MYIYIYMCVCVYTFIDRYVIVYCLSCMWMVCLYHLRQYTRQLYTNNTSSQLPPHLHRYRPSLRVLILLMQMPWWESALVPSLAFTRYCHHQYCMVYGITREGRGGSYIAQKLRNSIAVAWTMQIGGGNEGVIDSCTPKNK